MAHVDFQGDSTDIAISKLQVDPMEKAADDISAKLLDLDERSDIGSHHNNDLDDEDGMKYIIRHASKAGDLFPKHTNSFEAKKGYQ